MGLRRCQPQPLRDLKCILVSPRVVLLQPQALRVLCPRGTGQKETGSDPECGVNVIPIDTWEQATIWRRRQRMVSFDCNGTISEAASTNRSEVLFVGFGHFSFVVAS